MAQESEWIDYNMIISEIHLHRNNAQRQIKEYREKGKERDLTKSEYGLYNEEVGKEIALMCLERWCMDFKFSISEIKEMEDNMTQEEKKLPEGLEEAAKEYADGIIHIEDALMCKAAFIAGAEWMKAKMLGGAVEGVVYRYESYQRIATAIVVDIPKEYLGNKVKIIIVKEDK